MVGNRTLGVGSLKRQTSTASAIHELLCEPHTLHHTYSPAFAQCSTTSSVVRDDDATRFLAGEGGLYTPCTLFLCNWVSLSRAL